jgi:glyoxylase-like metal-dependent hydrolase (beta-lactamase superfamily II)
MKRKHHAWFYLALAAVLAVASGVATATAQDAHQPPKPPKSLRLYVFDCGLLQNFDPMPMFGLRMDQIAVAKMVVPCYLIVDPKGTMMWDTGIIPDSAFKPDGQPVTRGKVVEADKPLLPQLAQIGYTPDDITYICLSHYHSDHSANVGLFAHSTWLVRKIEYDQIFSGQKIRSVNTADFAPLKNSKTVFINTEDYDVFGDGKVIIKSAPGHTPGHQVLYLKLKHTGGVVIAGDMYHFPEERTLNHFPPLETDVDQARASRAKIEAFVKKVHAQLWMEHGYVHGSQLKKSPDFYD